MKKKVLAGIFVIVLALISVVGVTAANSPTAEVTLDQSHQGYYIIRTDSTKFTDDNGQDIPVKQDILEFNNADKSLEELLAGYQSVLQEIGNRKQITTIFDLHDLGGGQKDQNNMHRVALYIPTLTEKCSDVVALHYSMEDNVWEVIADEEDIANKKVTVITDDLSPIAIFATVAQDTPTGDNNNTGMWAVLAIGALAVLVVLGAGAVYKKKK